MPLPFPNLDDRNFKELVRQARDQIGKDLDTDWTDLSPGDPGIVLLEAFAYLTDQMIYRLNRLPRKVYIAFLRMLGVTLTPPIAARVALKVWHPSPASESIHLPRGSLVSTAEGGAAEAGERPLFTTVQDVEIPPTSDSEEKAVSMIAYHCERVEESLGLSTGDPGQVFQVKRPPIVAVLPDEASWLDLVVEVEIPTTESEKITSPGAEEKTYRRWTEVDNFSEHSIADEVFMVDRQAGLIRFAPAARASVAEPVQPLAAIPPRGCEIRLWYPSGGGEAGNVREKKLTSLVTVPGVTRLPALQVTNPQPARGGYDPESLENALVRGPQEIYSQSRAVTAREFESIVLGTRQVARARALAQASLWQHAVPGTVDIIMVPRLTKGQTVDLETLLANQEATNLSLIQSALEHRSPIGIHSQLRWARYKPLWVNAQVTYSGNEDSAAIQKRVTEHLNRLISPLPAAQHAQSEEASSGSTYSAGWPFGQQLRVADIYSLIHDSAGSGSLITSLDLNLVHAPREKITCLAADIRQPNTWFAGSGQKLFRSTNNGSGWELVLHLDQNSKDKVYRLHGQNWLPEPISRDETVRHVCSSPDRPGLVALSAEATVNNALQSSLYLSLDCGESWYQLAIIQESGTELQPGEIEDMAWLVRGNRPILLLASDNGLMAANLDFGSDGRLQDVDFFPVPVRNDQPAFPAYALAVVRSRRGSQLVVVALKRRGGVYMAYGDSLGSAKTEDRKGVPKAYGNGLGSKSPFEQLPIIEADLVHGEDIRHLNVQVLGDRTYLWAAVMALKGTEEDADGQGCYRWEFDKSGGVVGDGRWVSQNWNGGSCLALAFDQNLVYAATYKGGLLRAEIDEHQPDQPPAWDSFPIREDPLQDLPRRPTQIEDASHNKDFEPLIALDAHHGVVMVASQGGVYRRLQPEPEFKKERYENISRRTLRNLKDVVTLPPDWLLISGHHLIQAIRDESSLEEGSSLKPVAPPEEPPESPNSEHPAEES